MKISKFVDVNQKNLEITSKMMENIWKFTAKPGKIIEKSLNFVSLEKVGTLITEHKTGNNVSEFMHSNWITPSYYSSPKCIVDFRYMLYSVPSVSPLLLVAGRSFIYQKDCLNE